MTLIKNGCKVTAGGESWVDWALFKRDPAQTDDEVRDAIDDAGYVAHYGGPGRAFANEPAVDIRGDHVLVRQHCGLDV